MKRSTHLPAVISLILMLGLYAWTQSPHPGFGDGLGFLLSATTGWDWDTNASSHFLYILVCRIAVLTFPQADPAWVLSSLSVLSALIVLVLLYRCSLRVVSPLAASVACLSFGLGFTFWRQAVSLEVYSFYLIWITAALDSWIKGFQSDSGKVAQRLALLLGLATLTHIQTLLLLPLFLYFLYRHASRRQSWLSLLLYMGLFSILLWLPLWHQHHDWQAVFFDNRGGAAVLGFSLQSLWLGASLSLGYLAYQFHVWLCLIGWGLQAGWKAHRSWMRPLLLGLVLPVWAFAMRYGVSDSYVFYLLPYLVLAIMAGLGAEAALSRLSLGRWQTGLPLGMILLSLGLYATSTYLATKLPQLQSFAAEKAYKGGLPYYLWPGQRHSVDPRQLAQEITTGKRPPIPDFERLPVARQLIEKEAGQ